MEKRIIKAVFTYLESLLPECSLFLVGGGTRDYVLNRDFTDFDFAVSLNPDELKNSKLNEVTHVDFSFIKFGIVNLTYKKCNITLASMRKEGEYTDSRHPKDVTFITSAYDDSFRRDFTINAIYMDSNFEFFDPQKGFNDISNKTIRMIGDVSKRINEDPLRIVRAYRFSLELSFKLEPTLEKFINEHKALLNLINPVKIQQEIKKIDSSYQPALTKLITW